MKNKMTINQIKWKTYFFNMLIAGIVVDALDNNEYPLKDGELNSEHGLSRQQYVQNRLDKMVQYLIQQTK